MSETVYEAFTDKSKDESGDSDAPVLGQQSEKRTTSGITANGVVVRYFVGTLTNENDVLMLQDIMTRSMKCRDQLKEEGDVLVIKEEGSFDKEGCYNTVVKYLEMAEDPKSIEDGKEAL